MYKDENKFFCIPHSTEATAVKFNEKVDEIQARVAQGDPAVREQKNVDDCSEGETPFIENKVTEAENTIPQEKKETPSVFQVVVCWFGVAFSAIGARPGNEQRKN